MSDAVIHAHGLHKRYGATVAVAELSLEIQRGALFGLLGPNGAGKSTTFGILCGWLEPTAGTATVLDTPCQRLHLIAGRVGAMPQDAAFPRQVAVRSELVHFARLAGMGSLGAAKEADRVLDTVGMRDVAGLRGSELSHGMLKRVALAQALIGSPEVLFLDEPTAGLDPAAARQVKDLVKSLTPAATVVISSHNLAEIQEICTHGAILDHGRVVTDGSIDVLTRTGQELTIEVRDASKIDLAALTAVIPGSTIRLEATTLSVSFDASADVAEVIAGLLRVLLAAQVPILGVRRGTSLETAFLEATRRE